MHQQNQGHPHRDGHLDLALAAGALAAQQAFQASQFNNRVNAYISRGYSHQESVQIARTIHLAENPPRYSVSLWWLGVALFSLMAFTVITSEPVSLARVAGLAFDSALAYFCSCMARCNKEKNEEGERDSAAARAWLRQNNL